MPFGCVDIGFESISGASGDSSRFRVWLSGAFHTASEAFRVLATVWDLKFLQVTRWGVAGPERLALLTPSQTLHRVPVGQKGQNALPVKFAQLSSQRWVFFDVSLCILAMHICMEATWTWSTTETLTSTSPFHVDVNDACFPFCSFQHKLRIGFVFFFGWVFLDVVFLFVLFNIN